MRDPLDRYMTPHHIVRAVVRGLRVPPAWTVLEPGVGHGVWLDELAVAGHTGHTIAYDVWGGASGLDKAREAHHRDFLTAPQWERGPDRPAAAGVDLVLGNPPFKLAVEFVQRALEVAPRVAFLLRSTFVEATANRAEFWRNHPCVGEWTVGDRIRFQDHHLQALKGSDSVCHSVFFFEGGAARSSWPRSVFSVQRGWAAPQVPWQD